MSLPSESCDHSVNESCFYSKLQVSLAQIRFPCLPELNSGEGRVTGTEDKMNQTLWMQFKTSLNQHVTVPGETDMFCS